MAEVFQIAGSAEEAAALKGPDAAFLAGGTEINRLGTTVHPHTLISIRKLDSLKGIAAQDGRVIIGSLCTFQEVIECGIVPEYIKDACRFMGSRTKRNMATVGGNIALLRDDSYLLPTLFACGAVLMLMNADGSTRDLTAAEYLAAKTDALILSVSVPETPAFIGANRQANTVESNARLTAALGFDGNTFRAAAAIKHCGLFVLDDLASLLNEKAERTEEELIAWANAKELPIEDDKVYGSAAYRRYLMGVVFAKLLAECGTACETSGEKGGRA